MSLLPTDLPAVLDTPLPTKRWQKWLLLLVLIYAMLLAVSLIGSGFKIATGEHARELFAFASNPVMGLIIGMVATALLQSSSTVTSIIVGMVAGGLPITIAVPMMMGANVGTSITNTLVSLGHVTRKEEFQRAFNAATIHDFFNVLSVVIFLPLEMAFGVLEKSSGYIVSMLNINVAMDADIINPIKTVTEPVTSMITESVSFLPSVYPGIANIVLGIVLIMLSITLMGRVMKSLMVGKARDILHHSIGKGPVSGIMSGTIMTVLVQSSSTSTSLMVPLVGTNVLKARDIYPFTLGANIGTCLTALIAAMGVTGINSGVALQIALVHLIYNVLGVIVIYGIPALRELPLALSYRLSVLAAERKMYGAAYITGLFFVMPLSVIFVLR
ncbi:Na/Pi symporter [Alteromonas halophila]|uniref:Sodium:phosphate symporter n=1 Tax=Alteromonas halophila TaxID=516698 RepID=A0A918JQC1_9ALTE|nr:Na/Pi symporter [Alteromonas halophila]GGW92362.1 sodium:phosphate symporter [Alteromonas halophila]